MLRRKGVKHEVLNAKNHEREANIIAQAGKPGAVTVATNMAGRGVDILLGEQCEGIRARNCARRAWTSPNPSTSNVGRCFCQLLAEEKKKTMP